MQTLMIHMQINENKYKKKRTTTQKKSKENKILLVKL